MTQIVNDEYKKNFEEVIKSLGGRNIHEQANHKIRKETMRNAAETENTIHCLIHILA